MQTIASTVTVVDKTGETKEYVAPTILLHDFGLFVKNDSGLTLYNWDQVKEISWGEPNTIQQVWGLAIAQLATDLELDDDYLWDDEDEDEEDEEETKAPLKSEKKETPAEEKKAEDDNPYE